MAHNSAPAALLSLAVHELRTPVSVISGYIRMLLRHFGDTLTDQQRKLLEESDASCRSLAGLLAELSDLANLEDGTAPMRHQPVRIGEVLAEVASAVHEGEDRGVKLEVRGAGRRAVVMGDPERLRGAIASLLTATLRERAEAGKVVAACAVPPTAPPHVVIALADEDAAEQMAKAGDAGTDGAFDESRGGMGFRLPIAARVIAAHGGRLASPVTTRGHLSIVLSLPLAPKPGRAL